MCAPSPSCQKTTASSRGSSACCCARIAPRQLPSDCAPPRRPTLPDPPPPLGPRCSPAPAPSPAAPSPHPQRPSGGPRSSRCQSTHCARAGGHRCRCGAVQRCVRAAGRWAEGEQGAMPAASPPRGASHGKQLRRGRAGNRGDQHRCCRAVRCGAAVSGAPRPSGRSHAMLRSPGTKRAMGWRAGSEERSATAAYRQAGRRARNAPPARRGHSETMAAQVPAAGQAQGNAHTTSQPSHECILLTCRCCCQPFPQAAATARRLPPPRRLRLQLPCQGPALVGLPPGPAPAAPPPS